jgi:hypothetical protein
MIHFTFPLPIGVLTCKRQLATGKHSYNGNELFEWAEVNWRDVLGCVHTCDVTAYRDTVSWQCGRDSYPRNVSKVCYAVTLRAFTACCRYLAVASKGWYGYVLSRFRRATYTWPCVDMRRCGRYRRRSGYRCKATQWLTAAVLPGLHLNSECGNTSQ